MRPPRTVPVLALLLAMLVAGLPAVARSPASGAGERILLLPVPEDLSAQVIDGEPAPEGLVGPAILSGADLLWARPTEESGLEVVELRLDDDGAAALDAWAADHPGERMALVVDGTVVMAPYLRAEAFQGRLQVSGPPGTVEALTAALADAGIPVAAVPTGEVAAEVVLAKDPRFADLPDLAHLQLEHSATFDTIPLLVSSFYAVSPTSTQAFREWYGSAPRPDPRGSWLVEVVLVDGCPPVGAVALPFAADPCAARHSWTWRVRPDGTVTLLFEEGGPLPS